VSGRRRQFRFETVRDALVVVACAALLLCAGLFVVVRPPPVDPAAKPNPNGAYWLTLAAQGRGTGKAVVTAKKVRIDGTLDDGRGNLLTLSAPKLAIDSSTYRFSGTGTLNSSTVNISGRIDPPDTDPDPKSRALKAWRFTATFITTEGRCTGRVVGQQ
jgi:hypothetical protein